LTGPVLHFPDRLEEALEVLSAHGTNARPIAGGTALMIMLKAGLIELPHVVALQRLNGLRFLEEETGALRIGAMTTLQEVAASPSVRRAAPVLAGAASLVANLRVRNVATLGGNLSEADYASDPPCVLLAHDARVHLTSLDGDRWVPVSGFLRDYYETCAEPDELVTEVEVPALPPGVRGAYLKYVTRSAEDRPCLGVTAMVALDPDGRCAELRVAVGAATATPYRLPEVERMVIGRPMGAEAVEEVAGAYARDVEPLSDLRGSAAYRQRMIRVFVARAVREALAGRNGAVRV